MIVRLPEIEGGKDTFATRDLLGRKDAAHRLSDLADRVVIALDGSWGSGKSHFLKLWVGEHRHNGGKARLIYFDAFAHDFLDDPLVSLVLALEAETVAKSGPVRSGVNKLVRAAGRLALPVVRVGAAVASAGVSEGVAGVIGAAAQEADDVTEAPFAGQRSRIAAMAGFRRALADLAGETPLVFIIDELDRYRPDHALALLEIVKHFLGVPRVHVLPGTKMAALQETVMARHGAGIDAARYVQKFVNLTMRLPEPEPGHATKAYFDALQTRLVRDGHPLADRHDLMSRWLRGWTCRRC